MIRAYTFESAQSGGGQLAPYNAKVDARIRRDLFNGCGNLIIVGNRNGDVLLSPSDFVGSIGGNVDVKFNQSVTFVAGGRLFSITDQSVRIRTRASQINSVIGIGEFVVDVNTNAENGEYITIPEDGIPSYSEEPEAWETDTFSVTYRFVIVKPRSGVYMFPGPEFNGQNRAGGTVDIGATGQFMDGMSYTWMGAMTNASNLYLSQVGDSFTLSGKTDAIITNGDKLSFAKQSIAPYYLDINKGSITLWCDGWACIGDIEASPVANGSGYNFNITNYKTIAGTKPTTISTATVLATFNGSWEYF